MTRRFRNDAYTVEAVIEAGVPPTVARTLVADTTIEERPRLSVTGRKRGEPTTHYVWGNDANVLLSELGPARTPVPAHAVRRRLRAATLAVGRRQLDEAQS